MRARNRRERAKNHPVERRSRALAPATTAPRLALTMGAEDVVFLVPGFLGFESFGWFTYFADRVTAALRANLELGARGPVPVIAVPTLPTSSLAQRQRALLNTLAQRLRALGGAERVHLVGHSAGGVDAQLLTGARPLEAESWSALAGDGGEQVRSRIRTIVSIGSPHHGTCLAADAVAEFVHEPVKHIAGARPFGELFARFVSSSFGDPEVREALFAALPEMRKFAQFTREVWRWRELITALKPDSMQRIYATFEPALPAVRRRSFVTMSGSSVRALESIERAREDSPDAFFRDLSARTAGDHGRGGEQRVVDRALVRLRTFVAHPGSVIHSDAVLPPSTLDASTNDGIVNSARQLVRPDDPNELVAVVLADHFDVIGHYDRTVYIADENGNESPRELTAGLLHSGNHFRDNQFFELYRRVAQAITDEE
jgi:pimeloyl-ACP methyl ester carboxylesterase